MVVLILIFTKKHLKMIGVISDDSLSPVAQKRVFFHGFIHRLLTTPLSTKIKKKIISKDSQILTDITAGAYSRGGGPPSGWG